jgi:serine/threonine protein kinase
MTGPTEAADGALPPMKYCPVCENDYADDVAVCPRDGTAVRRPGSRPDPFIGRIIRDRYRVERELGKGGMGAVYLAEQLSVGRKVALKVLRGDFAHDEGFVQRFRQEAKLVASLNEKRNAHVTVVHDFDQTEDGSLFIVMEWLEGRGLNEVIQREGALQLPRAIRLATQIAQGLEAAHRAGVIHRDVKPHNVMVLGATDDIKLMDFGIARLLDSSRPSLTRAGTMMGTPEYMAPEQIDGEDVTEKTDIYAFGLVFYEMLTGTTPFHANTSAAVLTKQLREPPRPPRELRADIPADVEAVILRALQKDPAQRQPDMGEIVRALREISQRMGEGPDTERAAAAPTLISPGAASTMVSPGVAATLLVPASSEPSYGAVPAGGQTLAFGAPSTDLHSVEPTVDRPAKSRKLFARHWRKALITGAVLAATVVVVTLVTLTPAPQPVANPQPAANPPQATVTGQSDARPAEPVESQPKPQELAPLWTQSPEAGGGGAAVSNRPATKPPTGSIDSTPAPSKSPRRESSTSTAGKRPSGAAQTAANPQRVEGSVSVAPIESADQLRKEVEARLRSRSLLRGSGTDPDTGLTVEVDAQRIITLRGIVRDVAEREEAVRLARVKGVTEVRPRINVRDSWPK